MGGEETLARAVAHRLVQRPRDRRADELYMASGFGVSVNCRRLQLHSDLIECAELIRTDAERPVPGRSFKSVIAARADAYLKNSHDEGQIGPSELAMCIQARKTSQCLLPVIYPLAKEALVRAGHTTQLKSNATPEVRIIGGILGYAFDGHTREGREALANLGSTDERIREVVKRFSSNKARSNALTALLFAVEGGLCTEEVSDPAYEQLKTAALVGWSGIPHDTIADAVTTMREAVPMLNDIREEIIG